MSGTFVTPNTAGLSSIYIQKSAGQLEHFEELPPIPGYPAVIYGPVDSRSTGLRGIAIGIRDDLTYSVTVSTTDGEHFRNPCPLAKEEAALAIKTTAA